MLSEVRYQMPTGFGEHLAWVGPREEEINSTLLSRVHVTTSIWVKNVGHLIGYSGLNFLL